MTPPPTITRGAVLIYDPSSVARMKRVFEAALAYADLLQRIAPGTDAAAGLTDALDVAIGATDAWIDQHPSMRGPQP